MAGWSWPVVAGLLLVAAAVAPPLPGTASVALCPRAPDAPADDAEGAGLPDACDPGTNAAPVFFRHGVLLVAPAVDGGDGARFRLRARLRIPAPVLPALDPMAHGARLVMTDAAGHAMLDAPIPA